MDKKLHVLLVDGDSRQILPVMKGLHERKCEITTLSPHRLSNGYTSCFPDHKLLFSSDSDAELYQEILRLVQTRSYDVLIPLSDHSADVITEHEDEIVRYTKTPMPSRTVFLRAYDKQQTMEICMERGIPCTISKWSQEELSSFIERIGFPVVAKPRKACGSMGLKIISNINELYRMIENETIDLDSYVIQEFVPQTGEQINVHMILDKNGKMASGIVTEKCRWYPVNGGASCLCRTIHNSEILAQCMTLLNAIGWTGYCEIELIVDPRDGAAKVIEINGRASASIKIMWLAGVNVGEQMIKIAMEEEIDSKRDYPDDIRLRRLSADFLWLLQSPDRFKRKPNWFSPAHTHEATFDIQDPVPFLGTALDLLRRIPSYGKEMEKRSRN